MHNPSNFVGDAIVRTKIHRRGKEKKKSKSSFLDKWLYVKKARLRQRKTLLFHFPRQVSCSSKWTPDFMYFFPSFPPSLSPPTLDDSIWQELLIKKNPDCLCATPANLSGEMMFFAQQFLFSTECQHEENSWSDFLFSIQAWRPRNKSLQKEREVETNKDSLTKKSTMTFVRCYFQLVFLN